MDLQSRIADALADFDDLLARGISVEAALEVAAVENGVSVEVLSARASRSVNLVDRQAQVLKSAELAREKARRKEDEYPGDLFSAARRLKTRRDPHVADPAEGNAADRLTEYPWEFSGTVAGNAALEGRIAGQGQLNFGFYAGRSRHRRRTRRK